MASRNFWVCGNCSGRAVTLELLRNTFTPASINPLWLHAIRGEGTTGCRCPSCRNAMAQVALSENTVVNVDVCRICHFVWFDSHELERLVPQPPHAPPELPKKIREMLALAEIERIARDREGSDFDSAPPDEWWKNIAAFFGVPVEFDAPPQDHPAWITWLLCAAIVVSSLLAFPHLQDVAQQLGLIPAQFTRLIGLTFFTSFFLHGGIIHLVGNMYFLLVFGDNVENFLRPFRYLALIALAAVVGDLLHIAADPNSQLPCVGASGGIAGIITFYALKFPRIRLGFLLRWGFIWFRWIRMPAWFGLVLWGLFQIVGAFEQVSGVTSVSSFAHLGGGAVGVVAWLLWRRRKDDSAVEGQ